jgi:hypothetical protein
MTASTEPVKKYMTGKMESLIIDILDMFTHRSFTGDIPDTIRITKNSEIAEAVKVLITCDVVNRGIEMPERLLTYTSRINIKPMSQSQEYAMLSLLASEFSVKISPFTDEYTQRWQAIKNYSIYNRLTYIYRTASNAYDMHLLMSYLQHPRAINFISLGITGKPVYL